MELDEYINLEARVSGRMVLLDISATGEENVIDENAKEMNDLEYRRKQLQQLKEAGRFGGYGGRRIDNGFNAE